MSDPKAPAGLSARSKRLWAAVHDDYELSPAEQELLRTGLVALDEEAAATATLKAQGLTVVDRYGAPKQHPAVDVRNRARNYYAKVVAQLGIRATTESTGPGRKPGPKPRTSRAKG